jgi:rhomboid protease GluP
VHLGGNLLAWAAAWLPRPERRLGGAAAQLLLLGGCGLCASLASLLYYGQRLVVSSGPSGALLGVLVAALFQRGAAWAVRAAWLLAAVGLLAGGVLTGGDTAAHIGGAAAGLYIGLLFRATADAGD